MQPTDFFSLFIDRFNVLPLTYVVTGSAAVIAFGEPRLTNDIDVVLHLPSDSVAAFLSAFSEGGFYCPPEEVLRTELQRPIRGHFNLIHYASGLKADCYLSGTDSFQAWALENKKTISFGTHEICFAPLEYVVVKKLEFFLEGGSEKHLRDIRSLLAISGTLIDRDLLAQLVKQRNLSAGWEKV